MAANGAQTTFRVILPSGTVTYYSNHNESDPVMAFGLIQQKVDVKPAEPQLLMVDVPGANGSVDLTEALGVGIKYKSRTITWTYAMYPGADYEVIRSKVSNTLNGKQAEIILDSDPGWMYEGRLRVADYTADRLLQQITIEAICYPYKHKPTKSAKSLIKRANVDLSFGVETGEEWQVPEVQTSAEIKLTTGGTTYTLAEGTHAIPDWYSRGTFSGKISSTAAAAVVIRWREGSL